MRRCFSRGCGAAHDHPELPPMPIPEPGVAHLEPLGHHAGARFSVSAASILVVGALTRALTRLEGGSAQFLNVTLGVVACSMLVLLVQTRWQPHRRPLWRAATLVALRLAVGILGAVPFVIPEPPSTACAGFLWFWLTNSGAIAAFFLSLATSLPSASLNALLAIVQVVALAYMAGVRCELDASRSRPPGVSLVAADPGRCLSPLASVLDWPFHLTFPSAMLDSSAELSPRATCLACTLWAQAVGGLLLPVALLWAPAGQEAEHGLEMEQAGGDAAGSGERGDGSAGQWWQDSGERWLDSWLGEHPVLCTFFASQMLWMLLRTVCAFSLPRS